MTMRILRHTTTGCCDCPFAGVVPADHEHGALCGHPENAPHMYPINPKAKEPPPSCRLHTTEVLVTMDL